MPDAQGSRKEWTWDEVRVNIAAEGEEVGETEGSAEAGGLDEVG